MPVQHPYKVKFVPRPLLDVTKHETYFLVSLDENGTPTFQTNITDPTLLVGLDRLASIAVHNSCLNVEFSGKNLND